MNIQNCSPTAPAWLHEFPIFKPMRKNLASLFIVVVFIKTDWFKRS